MNEVALDRNPCDGSRTEHGVGAGILIESPSGLVTQFAFQLEGV